MQMPRTTRELERFQVDDWLAFAKLDQLLALWVRVLLLLAVAVQVDGEPWAGRQQLPAGPLQEHPARNPSKGPPCDSMNNDVPAQIHLGPTEYGAYLYKRNDEAIAFAPL